METVCLLDDGSESTGVIQGCSGIAGYSGAFLFRSDGRDFFGRFLLCPFVALCCTWCAIDGTSERQRGVSCAAEMGGRTTNAHALPRTARSRAALMARGGGDLLPRSRG